MTEATQTAGNGGTKAVATRAPLETGGKIMAIVPQNMEAAFRLANAVASAGVAPKAYLKNPKNESEGFDANKIMVGIMHGLEVGLPPMAALQSIAVINGMPTIFGDGALALIRASGLLESVSETIDGAGDTMRAVCTMRRRGEPDPIMRTFSVGDAKQAALWGKTGPWTQYPKRMMQMRARSWAMRDGFADVLKGLVPREEAIDMGTLVDAGDGTLTPPPPRPTRKEFTGDPAAAGHEDLDERFRETVPRTCGTAKHDPETGEIIEPTAATGVPAADATHGPVNDEPGSDVAEPSEAVADGAHDDFESRLIDCKTLPALKALYFSEEGKVWMAAHQGRAQKVYNREWDRIKGAK